jgi:AcrR family transcriptional regulator
MLYTYAVSCVKACFWETLTYDAEMTTTRTPLSRDRIVAAAVALSDLHGVEGLSMRKLGTELGVEAMSLYNHIENKDDIYDGMIDHVFSSIPLPGPEVDWRQSLREIGAAAMEQFTKHSWVVHLLMQRGNFGPGALAFMNRVLGVLRTAGFSDEDTHHAWQMLASHTMGYALQSASGGGGNELEGLDLKLRKLGDRFPHVVALAPLLAQCEFGREYSFGLEIIISGLETRLG